MRKLLFLSLLCIFVYQSVFAMDSCQKDGRLTQVILQESNQDPETTQRSLIQIDCYYNENTNQVYILATTTMNATIEIHNYSTGNYSVDSVALSPIPLSLPLSGMGIYHIVITLSDGISYYGDFEF